MQIDGEDPSLPVLVLDGEPDNYIKQSVDLLVQSSDQPNQKVNIKNGKLEVNGQSLNTYEYQFEFFEGYMAHTWAVELPPRNGSSRVLSFSREYEDGKLSKECRQFEEMVIHSLKFED